MHCRSAEEWSPGGNPIKAHCLHVDCIAAGAYLTAARFERSIHSAVYSPDGQLIATAIDDPEARDPSLVGHLISEQTLKRPSANLRQLTIRCCGSAACGIQRETVASSWSGLPGEHVVNKLPAPARRCFRVQPALRFFDRAQHQQIDENCPTPLLPSRLIQRFRGLGSLKRIVRLPLLEAQFSAFLRLGSSVPTNPRPGAQIVSTSESLCPAGSPKSQLEICRAGGRPKKGVHLECEDVGASQTPRILRKEIATRRPTMSHDVPRSPGKSLVRPRHEGILDIPLLHLFVGDRPGL